MKVFRATWCLFTALSLHCWIFNFGCKNLNAEEPSSLLANFSFEDWNEKTNLPVGWAYWSHYNDDHAISSESQNPFHGKRALRVCLPHNGFSLVQQYIGVQPQSKYRLTFMSKGAFLGKLSVDLQQINIGFLISMDSQWNFQEDWQRHSYEFETKDGKSIGVGFRFSGKGIIWLDHVILEKL